MNKNLSSNYVIIFILIVLATLSALFFTKDWGKVNATNTPSSIFDSNIHFLEASGQSVSFDLQTGDLSVSEQGVATASDLTLVTNVSGAPALPYFSTLVALPDNAQVEVLVENRESAVSLTPTTQIRPAPSLDSDSVISMLDILDADSLEQNNAETYLPQTYIKDGAIYGNNAFYPAAKYTLSDPFTLGDLTVVRLDLFPIQYNPSQNQLTHFENISVRVNFVGSQTIAQTNTDAVSTLDSALYSNVINAGEALQWASMPSLRAAAVANVTLPVGAQTYKITVTEDGIYELTYADLQAAGMDVNNINPQTFQMMNAGEAVAFDLVDNGDTIFSASESIRFYGWKFTGTRAENRYINDRNIFWLWADGTTTRVQTGTNPTGFSAKTSFRSSITAEEDTFWSGTGIYDWSTLDNEAEDWYWDTLYKYGETVLSRTYQVELPHPDLTSSETADFLAEFTSSSHPIINSVPQAHVVKLFNTNDSASSSTRSWFNASNVNVTGTMPNANLLAGTNDFQIDVETVTQITAPARVRLNRITVDYMRETVADNDMLILSNEESGDREFIVSGMSLSSDSDAIVWNITNPHEPVAVPITNNDVIDNGLAVSYRIGSSSTITPTFIATNRNAIKSPDSISEYSVPDIVPANGADWVAISYVDFLGEANRLAAHRADANYGGLSTHVVDFVDIVNQYGYGFPTPASIQDYLRSGLQNWPTPPQYVVLVGDANHNPGGRTCSTTCFSFWDNSEQNFVITDLVFEDRFDGKIPSDHTFSTLIGNDLIPDLAIGRIGAQTVTETKNAVDKIIQYEQNLLSEEDYLTSIVFMSDDTDAGGNFCAESEAAFGEIPSNFNIEAYCMPDDNTVEKEAARVFLFDNVNPTKGASIVNYRGHGGVNRWTFIDTTDAIQDRWNNSGQPVVVLSADCLDGNFAYPGYESLSETTLIRGNGEAVAAHWSSTGLGYSFEHSVMHEAFYEAVFEHGLTAIGDAIIYSKAAYAAVGYDDSELYAFTLQGDPAMQLFRSKSDFTKTAVSNTQPNIGDTIDYTLTVNNTGIMPLTNPTITDTLPAGISFESYAHGSTLADGTTPLTVNTTATQGDTGPISFTLPSGVTIPVGGSYNLTLSAKVDQVDFAQNNGCFINNASFSTADVPLPAASLSDTAQVCALAPAATLVPSPTNTPLPVATSTPQPTATPQAASLALTIGSTESYILPDLPVTFDVTVLNGGGLSATDPTMSIVLPAGISFDSFAFEPTLSDGTAVTVSTTAVSGDTGSIAFTLPSGYMLPAGEQVEFTITTLPTDISLTSNNGCADINGNGTFSGATGTTAATPLSICLPNDGDLQVSLTATNVTVAPNDTANLQLTLQNNASTPTNQLSTSITLPAGTTITDFTSQATLADGTPITVTTTAQTGDTGTITFDFPSTLVLPANESINIDIELLIGSLDTTTDCAQVTAMATSSTSNNQTTGLTHDILFCSTEVDLDLDLFINDVSVNPGQTVTFDVMLENDGAESVGNIEIMVDLPTGVSFYNHGYTASSTNGISVDVSTTANAGDTGTLIFTLPSNFTLPANDSIQFEVHAIIDQMNQSLNNGCLVTLAMVDSYGAPIKPYKLNATATACAPQTNLTLTKTVVDDVVNINDLVVFNIDVTNNGSSPAAELNIVENLPTGLSYVSHTIAQDFTDGSSITLNTTASVGDIGDITFTAAAGSFLPRNETVTIQLVAQLDSFTPVNSTDTCLKTDSIVSSFGIPTNSGDLIEELSLGVGSECRYIYYFPFMSKSE